MLRSYILFDIVCRSENPKFHSAHVRKFRKPLRTSQIRNNSAIVVASNRIIATSTDGKNDLKYFTKRRTPEWMTGLLRSILVMSVTLLRRRLCNSRICNLSRLFLRSRLYTVAPWRNDAIKPRADVNSSAKFVLNSALWGSNSSGRYNCTGAPQISISTPPRPRAQSALDFALDEFPEN